MALFQRIPQVEQDGVGVGEVVKFLQVDQHLVHAWLVIVLGVVLGTFSTTTVDFMELIWGKMLGLLLVDNTAVTTDDVADRGIV